ncbi:hypothetical protein CWB96_16250 [Pseudoalteromonas citrea]|uniref:Uncharacterized protein n=1 Tax=Pseudoalteromonas citrea TaxID=43655 RepID=A0A5S3XL30_9GAMM|nr:hypothetical protein [Pseudoalteromonas citrea]TMP44652.1 hypothetical protein CWB97_06315 [Pseudoalteromonas citrea]TMP55817.1 hypothetical protein CWB96_16250 [Pseudoalteromonas citrea]
MEKQMREHITLANIGHVKYIKTHTSGKLNAVWVHNNYGQGTGIAVSQTASSEFEGTYQVTYFDMHGLEVAHLDLKIVKSGDVFNLTWLKNNAITSLGVGMIHENALCVGYCDTNLPS